LSFGNHASPLFLATNRRHDGGCGTVHANSPAEVPARLEALASLGGLDRGALHSQLAAAVQVVIHVSRGARGRRLSEIAVLRRDEAGFCQAVPAWQAGRGRCGGAELLGRLIDERAGR
jgi:pilus assembly protein CpaF